MPMTDKIPDINENSRYGRYTKVVARVFCIKGVLKNFAKFTGKQLYKGLFFNNVAGLRQEKFLYSDIFRGYRNGKMVCNRLN